MTLSAKWSFYPLSPSWTIKVKGAGPDGLRFSVTTASQEDGFVAIHDVECEMPLPDAVAYYPAMEIEWRFSMDSGATWLDAGVCENSVYVTLGDPLTSPLYHTLAHLGCGVSS